MTLNPLRFAEAVNKQYRRYQLTAHRLTYPVLRQQMEDKLWHKGTDPLTKGPYVSISRSFEEGTPVKELIRKGVLHPGMANIVPYEALYAHQQESLELVQAGHDVLVSTGTGSGKTEAFLYPILNRILLANAQGAPPGVMALIVYPMNALATDQLERLRDMLVGTGITFGMLTGETPADEGDKGPQSAEDRVVTGQGSKKDWERDLAKIHGNEKIVLHPLEERFNRKMLRENPPRILLTNASILEFALTRTEDLPLLADAPLEFLVVDEAHTQSGAQGAEVAVLLRRVKAATANPAKIRCIAASATIADRRTEAEGRRFMQRLFGLDPANVRFVWERYKDIPWPAKPQKAIPPTKDSEAEALFNQTMAVLLQSDHVSQLEDDVKHGRASHADYVQAETSLAASLETLFANLNNQNLAKGPTARQRLYDGLLEIDFVRSIYETSAAAGPLDEQVSRAWEHAGRGPVRNRDAARWEFLAYVALGAAAEHDGNPLLRPKLHYFVKGLEDACVVFLAPTGGRFHPELHFSPEQAKAKHPDVHEQALFRVNACPRCGQHHYVSRVLTATELEKGQALTGGTMVGDGEGTVFMPADGDAGHRVFFTDFLLNHDGDYEDGDSEKHLKGYACRACGALHVGEPARCGNCQALRADALVPVRILNRVDQVNTCPVCAYGPGFTANRREDPFRALREITVRNVYVLAQDMLALAEAEKRKLIIFADNRQDAAFQAGWMKDRARKYRFRQLLIKHLKPHETFEKNPDTDISLGSIIKAITLELWNDKTLARFIAPEVFAATYGDNFQSSAQRQELEKFVAIQLLQEVASPYSDSRTLESLGLMRVVYAGLDAKNAALGEVAHHHGIAPADLARWIECCLDILRKRGIIAAEPVADLFTRSWKDTWNPYVHNRYVASRQETLRALRVEQDPKNPSTNVLPIIGRNGTVMAWAKRGLLPESEVDEREALLRDVWRFLVDGKFVRVVRNLQYSNGDAIPHTSNVYVLDGASIGITSHDRRYQCAFCSRLHGHETTLEACTKHNCKGTVRAVDDSKEPKDYDRVFLETARRDDAFVMSEEHSAQVPKDHRQEIERRFKQGIGVNCLVSTPTLELGVDIGDLDLVLMRNVAPTPANYWQRAGRAGRRHRMAVVYSYGRNRPHDAHYYKAPERLLQGAIEPPKFNLANPIMLRKHVHACLLTYFHGRPDEETAWLKQAFPSLVGQALFGEGGLRETARGIADPLRTALAQPQHAAAVTALAKQVLEDHWPAEDLPVPPELLQEYLARAPDALEAAYSRVLERLQWAQQQQKELNEKESSGADPLTPEEERFRNRCKAFIRRFHPRSSFKDAKERQRAQNTAYTLKVLAVEGFLPGYANSTEQVTAVAAEAYSAGWTKFSFDLNRAATLAIREHVPGNLIYANGGKYRLTNFMFPADDETRTPLDWVVNPDSLTAYNHQEVPAGTDTSEWLQMKSLPLVDSQLQYMSHVEDVETTRFRMYTQVAGVLRAERTGGTQYTVGGTAIVEHRLGQRITLLNVGAGDDEAGYGFLVCQVCGSAVSPYDQDAEKDRFRKWHKEHHGQEPKEFALHVNATVDGLLFRSLATEAQAASFAEAFVTTASMAFDMEREDFGWFPIAQPDGSAYVFIFDHMAGGSGLLQQILDDWVGFVARARQFLGHCIGECPDSCYQCLRTYYNQFWHDMLDRADALAALESFAEMGTPTPLQATLRPRTTNVAHLQTNPFEKRLEQLVVKDWGFTGFVPQHEIPLPAGAGQRRTIADLADPQLKVVIYLDGKVHAEAAQVVKDKLVRRALIKDDWIVIEIHARDLDNQARREEVRHEIGACVRELQGNARP